jgi:ribosomal protein S18 acetylase RimI-like enzyme
MNAFGTLRLAHRGDARGIAVLSRDLIERGLGWSWTTRRVLRSLADRDTNVLVALDAAGALQGFGIMKYGEDEAHLLLLAVQRAQARSGIGTALVQWLEAVAQAAGAKRVSLEARASNAPALSFYKRLGYREVELMQGYYQGQEDCIRLVKDFQQPAGGGQAGRAGDGAG